MKAIVLMCFLTVCYSGFSQNQNTVTKGRRDVGVGINYVFPAMGVSGKLGLTDNFKLQGTISYRGYDFGFVKYSWTMIGAEIDYCFDESTIGNGWVLPFIYAGLGRGSINYDLIDDNSWWSYNVGGGLEFFPAFVNNNLGFLARLGFGSIGVGGSALGTTGVSVNGVFMYGIGIHYYIK